MSVKRCDIIKYFNKNGIFLKREGARHSIYSDGNGKIIPLKRHKIFDRVTANALCKQAGLEEIF